jgi:hypothetical protein
MEVVRAVEKLPVDHDDRPKRAALIADCGMC